VIAVNPLRVNAHVALYHALRKRFYLLLQLLFQFRKALAVQKLTDLLSKSPSF
jgi:hypothetical protein